MKKIGTITFHRAINVGAILQGYALQVAIHREGIKSELLDYRNAYIEKQYSPLSSGSGGVLNTVKMLIALPFRLSRAYRFHKFTKENLMLSKKLLTDDDDFKNLENNYSLILTGSDQVWNPYHAGRVDGRYFLDFVKDTKKKGSYAASFGLTELPEEFHNTYNNLLGSFENISVRESSAVHLVKEVSGKEATQVLDPVYLLNKDDWETLAKKPTKIKSPYLLFFCVNGLTDDLIEHSLKVAQDHSLTPVFLSQRPMRIKGAKTVWNFGPSEFLGYIFNADYVITDSFHAMSFAIIFQKDFLLKIASQHGNKNNRSLELMSLLGIGNRLIGEPVDELNWNAINSELARNRQQSLEYLKRVIGAVEDE